MSETTYNKSSYAQILKSTGIIGTSQLVIIFIGILRTKVLAVLLGPIGMGISTLYQSTLDLIKSVTNLGISFSAVREIAADENVSSEKLSKTIKIVRSWLWFTGLLGTLTAIIFCKKFSFYAFGDSSHARGIAILSVVLLFTAFSSGYLALLQGLRRIKDVAKANVLGTLAGFIVYVLILMIYGIRGIVPAILISALFVLLSAWFFFRKVKTTESTVTIGESFRQGTAMAKLGLFTVAAGFVEVGTMYLVRTFVSRNSGLYGVGQFMAAWSVSTIYISAVLTAMSSDYFPRLSTVQHDQKAMNRIINEQTEIALLIACPIIIGMISFVTLLIKLFYSKDFYLASKILNWQLVGDLFKILSWAIGYSFLAKGKGSLFAVTNLLWSVVYLLTVFLCWQYWNIESTGIGFILAYIGLLTVHVILARRLFGFLLSQKVMQHIFIYMLMIILAFLNSKFSPQPVQSIIGVILTAAAIAFSFSKLSRVVSFKSLKNKLVSKI